MSDTTPPPIPTTPTMEECIAWLDELYLHWPYPVKDLTRRHVAALRETIRTAAANLQNAARYEWLRKGGPGGPLYVADSGRDWNCVTGEELDERIDEAIADAAIDAQLAVGEK